MGLFVFNEIYLSHDKFVKPLNPNVHVGSPLFDAITELSDKREISTRSIRFKWYREGVEVWMPGNLWGVIHVALPHREKEGNGKRSSAEEVTRACD
jgi:hypothetical protein